MKKRQKQGKTLIFAAKWWSRWGSDPGPHACEAKKSLYFKGFLRFCPTMTHSKMTPVLPRHLTGFSFADAARTSFLSAFSCPLTVTLVPSRRELPAFSPPQAAPWGAFRAPLRGCTSLTCARYIFI
jgi:hypothetical protein